MIVTDACVSLNNQSLCFTVTQQIGIVGRTGAGKSSVIQALFRMAEPKGEILVDKLVFNDMGLHDVRGSMSIIPQVIS